MSLAGRDAAQTAGNYRKTKWQASREQPSPRRHDAPRPNATQMLFENRQLTKIDEARGRMGSPREWIIFGHVETSFGSGIRQIGEKISNFSTLP